MCKPFPKKRLSRNSIASSSNGNIIVTEVHKHDDSDDKFLDEKLKLFNNKKGGKRLKLMDLKIGNFCQKKPLKVCLSNFLVHPKLLLKMK